MKKNNKFSRKAAVYYAEMIYFPNSCLRTKNSLYSELNILKSKLCVKYNLDGYGNSLLLFPSCRFLEFKLISAVSGVIERNTRTIDISLSIAIFLLDHHHCGVIANTNTNPSMLAPRYRRLPCRRLRRWRSCRILTGVFSSR